MIEQRIQNRTLKGWRGLALMLAIAAAVILGSNVFYWLGRYIGNVSSILFIAYGCAIAWFLLNWYVMGFIYACDGGCLRVCRVYGKRQRFMLDVWLNSTQACGTLDAMKKRFPAARVQRAVKPEYPIEPLAVAYDNGGRTTILLLQPDKPLRQAILQAVKR